LSHDIRDGAKVGVNGCRDVLLPVMREISGKFFIFQQNIWQAELTFIQNY